MPQGQTIQMTYRGVMIKNPLCETCRNTRKDVKYPLEINTMDPKQHIFNRADQVRHHIWCCCKSCKDVIEKKFRVKFSS